MKVSWFKFWPIGSALSCCVDRAQRTLRMQIRYDCNTDNRWTQLEQLLCTVKNRSISKIETMQLYSSFCATRVYKYNRTFDSCTSITTLQYKCSRRSLHVSFEYHVTVLLRKKRHMLWSAVPFSFVFWMHLPRLS